MRVKLNGPCFGRTININNQCSNTKNNTTTWQHSGRVGGLVVATFNFFLLKTVLICEMNWYDDTYDETRLRWEGDKFSSALTWCLYTFLQLFGVILLSLLV